ncbi:unnamed protein product [Chilo suppressalis]|uniref:Uncharacterized protein n=1 Tax=Chilo suppressalis TaxID=168631 RepID=A0ABN8L707_CHISP|nr:unnamed protein product [Chilo suppressalis]
MGRHIVLISLLIVFIINYCVCELSVEKKQKIYNGFVSYLKNLPDQPYYLHNGILKNIVETSENGYSIEVDFRGEDTDAQDLKFVKCYGTVYDKQESGVEVANGYQCHVESDTSTPADSIEEVVTEWLTTEPPELHQPIKLDNEVQTEPVTSGEQFIAVPRDGQPCIGCASQVNPEAAGVTDLALLGIRQLDQLEPSVIHSLNKVIMVERQVQVVNGVRYILTILIDYNSCSQNVAEECVVTKTCKVSVLDKPWAKLPDGSRYRVVVANNCTADWIFEEIGETRDSERDKPQNPQLPTPHYGEVPNIGTFEDIIHSVRNPDVQSQPEIEKSLTDEEIRNIQQQIIPNSQFSQQSLEKQQLETNNVHGNDLRAHQVVNTESQSSFVHSNPTNNLGKISHGRNGISDEKKKVIDDLLNFFDYAGFKQKNDGDKEASRMKRSFEKELHTFDLAENFNKMRKNIDSAKHIYALAQSMVDYLNEMDMSIKNRLLSSVISAEEESENNHRYFYVQARIIIPCDKVECNNKDEQIKICNGVIDGTNERSPQVMNTFCHNEKGKKNNIGKNNIVPPGDPILSKLAYTALKTIELESQEDNALYIIKIHNANTQKLSGTLTKIAILLGHTNCSKSVGLYKRKNCTKVEKMGTKLCDVEILEKGKEKKISYICTDRPVGESFVNKKLKYGIDDPDVDEILEEALQYLEIQSNKNNKQRVVDVKSVSTRLVGGLLTNIEFLVGYTKCTNNNDIGRDYCEFLKNETFRNCEAQIWQRPWLEDERQMKVLCEDDISNPVTENGNDFRIRKRRQVASQPLFGGLTKQDKNDPRYKAMAEESLQKYLQTSGATGPHRVVTIDNVKSQVVAGSLTTIDFTVLANNADVIKCHSKIWEQPWINKKEIDVTCALANEQNRGKRQVPGGEKQQDKNDPRYKAMAEESLQKYLQTSGATGPHRVVTIDNVKSQVVAGSLTTIDFTVLANNADVIKCHSKIWEQPWINKKEIDVTCALANEQNREKRQVPGGEKQQDKNDPRYKAMAEESLQKYLQTSGATGPHRVVTIDNVKSQVVAGSLTTIDFTVLANNADVIKCHSKIWEQPWINKKEIDVTCALANEQNREKRQVPGGEKQQDKNDPRYKAMAEESLQKYLQTSGATGPHRVVTIDNVKSQVVAGSLTTIDFTVLANNADVIKCHSKIWEQPWINKKEIDVTCALANEQNREKRQVPGGEKQQDKNDPRYKAMAEESLQKYLQTSGATGPHRVVTIDNVKSQVVAGSLTTIDFTVLANNADVIKCHSKIWEQPWINKKEIDVTCALANEQNREKRQVPGGEKQQDKNDPRYKAMAEESLQKYLQTSGATGPHRVVTIDNVKSQVVAGSLTTIDFTVLANNADVIKCHSKIWEQPWINKKEIDVTCALANEQNRGKRQFPGGEKQQDKNDPRYKAMAEESLQKYLQTSGATGPHRVVTIDNVKSQVVAGSLTTIDFTVLANNADVIKCHSKIWVQPWINKKQIDVTCALANEQNRGKRQVPGGEKQQDKNDPRYKAMAEECLQKYLQTSGATGPHRIVTIDNVKSQVVVGSLTTIDFTVLANNADVIKCHSKIWEQPWINKKEIDVTCANEQNRVKRQLHEEISGGFFLQDPQSPEYTKLAEKSLLIFLNTSNVMQHYKVTKVTKVQTQVVSGFITKLVFLVSPTNCQITEDGKMSASSCDIQDSTVVKKCNSKVWDKPWRSSTVYSVKCFLNEDRQRREILRKRFKTSNYKMSSAHSKVGSTVEQDPSKNEYKILADESLRKYQLLQKSNIRQKILQVKRVETQVVSGTIYKIEYTAVPTTCSANVIDTSSCDRTDDKVILYCHTEIWDRPWLKRKNIDVSCIANKLDEDEKDAIISKRSVLGGPTSKDVDNELYKKMAKTALEKYQKLTKTEYLHKVLTITHVSEKVIQGFLTTIKFTISPTTCLLKSATDEEEDCPFQQPIAKLMCVAEIRERPVLDLTDEDITVTCHRKKHKNIKQISKRISKYDRNHDTREKRQTRTDENEIGDDAKYVYAHHAIKNINQRSDTDNLQKLITIYDVVTTYQMETPMVSMYIETAYTYCLKQNKDIDLNSCDELDGMNHRICFVRVFPSADDDLVVLKVVTVCDDEPNFVSVTHLSVPDLLTISLVALENSPDIGYKLVHRGEPYVVPSLHSHIPVKLSFIVASTNCSKYVKVATDVNVRCFVDTTIPDKECHANIWMMPVTKKILHISANCSRPHLTRTKRTLTSENTTANIQDMVDQSLEKLEMSSLHRYKQRVIKINSYSTKLTSGRVTTIDFDVGYTNCLKYEWVDDASTCQFIEHLPRRHCVSEVWERLWLKNGRKIEVTCQDDETPLEAHVEFESADIATRLAQQALKHIEAKYPHPKKQQLVRIFSLEKQVVAGIHYRMKIEVGLTDCLALSVQDNCHLINDGTPNRFCRVNVWLRPWTDHPPNFRVTCDYQAGAMTDMYHHVQAEQLFFNFITTYKPEYINDHVEMTKRFEIFKENVKKIHELNTHERGTGVYAVTRFTDLTYEEFKSKYLGLNPNLKKPNQIPMRQAEIPKVHQLPASFDWRPLGAVTEVKDQGACGSCWAFSVTGNIEGQWKLKTGKLLSLSEQELVDCDKMDDGCDGGYMDNAYRAIEQLGGLETEEEYPYEAEDDKCSFNKSLSKVQISGAVNISSNETNMAKWLVHNGPISIGINANAMQFYVGGVSHPWKALCNPKNIDHGVLIVGYGIKEYPLFNKQLPYWVVKNSWGPGWGEQGYYRVFRGDGTCGVNTMASSAVV